MSIISAWWDWLKANDAPNWFSIGLSLIIWPFFIIWLDQRKRLGIPHLEVLLAPDQMTINNAPHLAVRFTFTNRTGSVVYLSRARLREVEKNFPIPIDAARDILGGWRELKFVSQSGIYSDHERILQTGESAVTGMAVGRELPQSFYSFRSPQWRQRFRLPKYFLIEYIAMVGDRRYSVLGVY